MAKILIVDDEAFMRMILRNMLTKNFHVIIGEAENGLIAFEKYVELKPDIVTMDVTMKECDGITAAKNITEYDSNSKIIMCSAMGQQAMIVDAIQAGAKDFIVKPFQEDRVMETINKLIT